MKEALKDCDRTIDTPVRPHRHWYHYDIPEIQLSAVDKELISVEEASKKFDAKESDLRDLISSEKISCYLVRDETFLLKSELAKHFSR